MTGQSGKHNTPKSPELNQMSNAELVELLKNTKLQEMQLNAANQPFASKKNYNPGKMRQTRILIARILTIQRKRGG